MKLNYLNSICLTIFAATLTLAALGPGCSSSDKASKPEPSQQPQVREIAQPTAPNDTARATFIDEMATLFTRQLFRRIDVDKATYRLVIAVAAPTGSDAAEIAVFCDCLAGDPAFTDNFLLVRLEPGQSVSSLGQASSNADATQLPDGTSADADRKYPPDAVYYVKLGYSDARANGGGKQFTMTWHVEHPRSRQMVMSQKHTRSLVFEDGNWSLVEEKN